MREFYASYVASLQGPLDRRSNPANQEPLKYVRVQGYQIDISSPTIRRFLYGRDIDAEKVPLIPEFDYR